MRWRRTLAACGLASCCAAQANAACNVRYFAELALSSTSLGLTTMAAVNGQPTEFAVRSESFFSALPREKAQALRLSTKPISVNFGIYTRKGGVAAAMASVAQLQFGERRVLNAQFLVLGGDNAPDHATIGQNILALHETEFDLQNDVIRLSKSEGCTGRDLAYWAQPGDVRTVTLEQMLQLAPQAIGKALINGAPARAMFSTGTPKTLISAKTARAILGKSEAEELPDTIQLNRLDIGDEVLNNVTLDIATYDLGNIALVLGVDFFKTHRVYLSKSRQKLFFTSNAPSSTPTAATSTP